MLDCYPADQQQPGATLFLILQTLLAISSTGVLILEGCHCTIETCQWLKSDSRITNSVCMSVTNQSKNELTWSLRSLDLLDIFEIIALILISLISPYNLGYHLLYDWELEQISMPLLKIEENIFYSSSLFWPPNIPQGSCSSAMECTRKYFILHQVRTLIWGCRDNSQV